MEIRAAIDLAGVIALFATIITAAVTDLLQRKVYNWTTFPAACIGLAVGYLVGGVGNLPTHLVAGAGLLDRLAGLTLGFGIFYAVNLATSGKGVGLGDAKLMGAIGALTGAHFVITAMFWGSLVGAAIALWVLVWRGALLRGLRSAFVYAISLRRREEAPEGDPAKVSIPYGVALSFGTLLAFFLVRVPGA